MREANGAPCSALWWRDGDGRRVCRAAASVSSGNAVSMNGPGILMAQCRGAGAAVWQAQEERSLSSMHKHRGLLPSEALVSVTYDMNGNYLHSKEKKCSIVSFCSTCLHHDL